MSPRSSATTESIRQLVDNHDDEQALEKLARLGEAVLPLLRRAYARLDTHDWLMAQWYNRVLALVAPDPVSEALALLGRVQVRHCAELAWIVRRFATPQDATRFRRSLAGMLRVKELDELVWKLIRLAVLCEAIGLVGAEKDMRSLLRILDVALGELERLRQAGALHLSGPDVAPAAAACASALLAISERLGLKNEPEREYWRLVCLDTAVPDGYYASYDISGLMAPPMPFLFARAPQEGSRLVVLLSQASAEAGAVLSDLHYWLMTAREQGVSPTLGQEVEGALDWLDALGKRLASGGHGLGEVLNIRALLRPKGAQAEALENLGRPWLDAASIAHKVSILQQTSVFADMAAIAVESFFVQRSAGRDDDGKIRRALNKLLEEAGLNSTNGWAWKAPQGRLASVATPEKLHSTLCATAHVCAAAARATTAQDADEVLAALQDLPPHPLIKHARYRNLLLALKDAPGEVAHACLAPLCAEQDPAMARAVLKMAQAVLRNTAGLVYLLLLDAPAIRQDLKLAEQIVHAVAAAAPPGAGERLYALGRELGWGPGQGNYGVYLALAVAMGRLGVSEAVPVLVSLLGCSGLGSEIEVALLRLAARDPRAVDDGSFSRAFELAVADDYAELDASLMGDQARAHLVRTLREADLAAPSLAHACRFLAEAAPGGKPPPLALPLLIDRLPRALAAAQSHPGEAWEDRNWGGYNMSAEEELAQGMTKAVESLCEGTYSREGWRALLGGLLELPDLDLDLVATVESSSSTGVRYATRNVFARLKKNLLRRKEPAVEQALALTPPVEALRAVRAALA